MIDAQPPPNESFLGVLGSNTSITVSGVGTVLLSLVSYPQKTIIALFTIDSWSDIGIITGTVVTTLNFLLGIYTKFFQHHKNDATTKRDD